MLTLARDVSTRGSTPYAVGADFCRVRYDGGVSHGWMAADLQAAEAPGKSGAAIGDSSSGIGQPARHGVNEEPVILRPAGGPLVYHADSIGHFQLTATVNGAPIRVIVDTGATMVSLSLADAAAVGIDPRSLAYTAKANTANGESRAAPVMLRNVSIGQISIDNVPAVVAEKLKQSLLGMSVLSRLKGFEIREGSLIIR